MRLSAVSQACLRKVPRELPSVSPSYHAGTCSDLGSIASRHQSKGLVSSGSVLLPRRLGLSATNTDSERAPSLSHPATMPGLPLSCGTLAPRKPSTGLVNPASVILPADDSTCLSHRRVTGELPPSLPVITVTDFQGRSLLLTPKGGNLLLTAKKSHSY